MFAPNTLAKILSDKRSPTHDPPVTFRVGFERRQGPHNEAFMALRNTVFGPRADLDRLLQITICSATGGTSQRPKKTSVECGPSQWAM